MSDILIDIFELLLALNLARSAARDFRLEITPPPKVTVGNKKRTILRKRSVSCILYIVLWKATSALCSFKSP